MKLSLNISAQIAEVVAAIAVVIGLIFVGLEIRSNTVAQQFTATQILVSEYNAAIRKINEIDNICNYIRGSVDFNSLSQKDKIRWSLNFQPVLRNFEQLHYSELRGTIDANIYSGLQEQFAAIMRLPGYQQYWDQRRHWYGSVFQAYTDSVIANSDSVEPANFDLEECE